MGLWHIKKLKYLYSNSSLWKRNITNIWPILNCFKYIVTLQMKIAPYLRFPQSKHLFYNEHLLFEAPSKCRFETVKANIATSGFIFDSVPFDNTGAMLGPGDDGFILWILSSLYSQIFSFLSSFFLETKTYKWWQQINQHGYAVYYIFCYTF